MKSLASPPWIPRSLKSRKEYLRAISQAPQWPLKGYLSQFAILRRLCEARGHHFWTEDTSIFTILQPDAIILHSQITDAYLLGLAVHKRGKLATMDQRIAVDAVCGGGEALELIHPATD